MSRGLVIALGGALLVTGCAHPSLVLLADEDGGHGAVAIRKKDGTGGETLVSTANSRATLDGARPRVTGLGAKGLKPAEAQLLERLPPPARSFTLYFDEGTVNIVPQSLAVLDQMRAEIAGRPGADVQVTGHTDTVGAAADNDSLSRKRAEQVVAMLASKGFDRKVMSAVGRGERELREATADNVENAANRRVEVIVR